MPTVLAEAETLNELPIPPVAFGLIAFAVLLGLLAITWAFRSVGHRHGGPVSSSESAHVTDEHGDPAARTH